MPATQLGTRVPAMVDRPEGWPVGGKVPGFAVVNGHGGDKYSWYADYTGVAWGRAGVRVGGRRESRRARRVLGCVGQGDGPGAALSVARVSRGPRGGAVPGIAREALSVFSAAEWETAKGATMLDVWVVAARAEK